MKDKDLADRVVALGVVEAIDGFYYFRDKLFDRTAALTATQTARDSRVAMALMERCWSVNWKRQNTPAGYVVMAWSHTDASRHSRLLGDSLPPSHHRSGGFGAGGEMKGAGAAAWPTSLVDDPVRDAEEQLNQEWWAAQDSDDDWIASHEEKHDGHDAVCR